MGKDLVPKVEQFQKYALENWESAFNIAKSTNTSKSVASIQGLVKVLKNVKTSLIDLFQAVNASDTNKGKNNSW